MSSSTVNKIDVNIKADSSRTASSRTDATSSRYFQPTTTGNTTTTSTRPTSNSTRLRNLDSSNHNIYTAAAEVVKISPSHKKRLSRTISPSRKKRLSLTNRSTAGHSAAFSDLECGGSNNGNNNNKDDDNNNDDDKGNHDATTNSSTTHDSLPRLVLRNRPFGQSNNKIYIAHNQGWKIYALLKHNLFHAALRLPTSRSLLLLMSVWTGAILLFAGLYVWQDNLNTTVSCGLGAAGEPITWAGAFAFSLETCTTVGYGLPNGVNSFFDPSCGSLQFLIYCHMAWSMLFNAFLLAFLYARFGRSETRANQVINSRKALVSSVDGQVRFQVRMFDADTQHPVVEAHVRMYCVMHHRPVPRQLRLLQPDDEMGGMLFLSFPTIVSHHVDLYSLLHPPTESPFGGMKPSGLVLRQVDGITSNRDDVICPVCGESYGTLKRWKHHVQYQQIVESKENYPVIGTHLSLDMDEIEGQMDSMQPTNDIEELKEYFRQNVSEIIMVTEGIDPLQSGTFQSLQSYRFEDIVWDAHSVFAPCMTVITGRSKQKRKGEQMFQVDLDRYHDILVDKHQVQEQERRKQEKREEDEAQAAAAVMEIAEASSTSENSYSKRLTALLGGHDDDGDINSNNNADDGNNPTSMAAIAASAALLSSDSVGAPTTNGDAPTVKKRHRRIKSSSRRPGDALFVPLAEELELQKKPEELNHANSYPL